MPDSQIRPMTRAELQMVLGWAGAEGWNPGLDDADAYFEADPEGFLLRIAGGQPVAAISVVNHAPDLAFLGLFITLPAYRHQGHGRAIWQAGLDHAGGRSIGLDGVPAQQASYRKSGFADSGMTERMAGPPPGFASGAEVLSAADIETIIALDAERGGYARGAFLRSWLTGSDSRRSLLLRRNGRIAGYATGRNCIEGVKIGPLWAEDAGIALQLIGALARGQGPVYLDVAETAAPLRIALEAAGFSPVFSTLRMYRGPAPVAQPGAFEAVASLELG